jgi:hypothetical protein
MGEIKDNVDGLKQIFEEARDEVGAQSDEPARMKLLKHFVKSGNENDMERANHEFGEFGFRYNTQGAEYSSPMGVAVWVPKENIIVCHAEIFDQTHWFAIEMDPREVEELIHKLKGMSRAIDDVEEQENYIVGDWMKIAGIDEKKIKEDGGVVGDENKGVEKDKGIYGDAGIAKEQPGKVSEAANQQDRFWLVLDPAGPDSVIEDVLGNEPKTAIEIGRILIGGGNDSHAAITRWEKEHPALYIEEDEASAREDAEARLAAVKDRKDEDAYGMQSSGGVGSVGAP